MTPTPESQHVILITGGAKRLGLAMAQRLAAPGRTLALHYNTSRASAEQTATSLRALGAEVVLLAADLGSPEAPAQLAREAAAACGRIDVLINNAAIYYPTPMPHASAEQFDQFMNVNARGPFLLAQEAGRIMLAQESGGCIINLLDTEYDRPKINYIPYTMSKAALTAATLGMARALAPKVRVNGIAPGPVLLPEDYRSQDEEKSVARTALKRVGSADDIALAAEFLIFRAPYITGQILRVDGGRSIT